MLDQRIRLHAAVISRLFVLTTQVFKGLNESTGELFAVKQIGINHGSQEEIDTLETEIALMKDLNHRYSAAAFAHELVVYRLRWRRVSISKSLHTAAYNEY